MRFIYKSVLLAFLFMPVVAFSAGNFGIRTAYPDAQNPRTESIFIHTINPGETKEDGVRVINSTSEEKNILIYATDSVRSSGGSFACAQRGDQLKSVGSWIKFDTTKLDEEIKERINPVNSGFEINVPAGSEIIVPFSVSTPRNVSVGEHNGCIVSQEIKEDTGQAGLNLLLRSGIRVAVTIPGEVTRDLDFVGFSAERKDGSVFLKASVENIGNVSIDTDVEVKVKHFFGLTHKNFGGSFPVLRGEQSDFTFEFRKPILGGIYFTNATFSFDESENAVIGLNTGGELTKIKSDTFWFVVPPRIIGIVLWVFILFVIWFAIGLHKYKKKQKRWIESWPRYVVKPGETLTKIAKDRRIPWRLLARVNKIKPPFMLEEGDVIKIPPQRKKKDR